MTIAAQCGIQASEFWAMTPGQLRNYSEGYGAHMMQIQTLAAWHLAPQLNLWIGKGRKVTVAKLLGKETVTGSMFPDAASFKRYLDNKVSGVE